MARKIILSNEEQRAERAVVCFTLETDKGIYKKGFWDVCDTAKNVTATLNYCTYYDQKGEIHYLSAEEYSFSIFPLGVDGKLEPEPEPVTPTLEERQITIFDILEANK